MATNSLGGFAVGQPQQAQAQTQNAGALQSPTPATPAYTGAPTQAQGFGQGAPSGTLGAPSSGIGPTMANQQTGNFNTNYIDPAQSAVHSVQQGPAYDQQVKDAYYNEQKAMLDPQWQHQQADAEAQLANMGLSRGSEAWNREKARLDQAQDQSYQSAQRNAIMAGGAESTRQLQDQIAAGNFANQAGQQDYQNQITSQQAQNAGNTAQQNAAQGWQGFKTQEKIAEDNLKSQQASQAAARAVAAASAHDARITAQQSYDLQNRQMNINEGRFAYDVTSGMNVAPDQQRTAALTGYAPPTNPAYSPIGQGSYGNTNSQGYADSIGQANTAASGGYGDILGGARSLGGYAVGTGPGSYGYNQTQNIQPMPMPYPNG